MAFKFYKISRDGNKYVFKKKFEQFLEIDSINAYNELFKEEFYKQLKKNNEVSKVLDSLIWKFSIIKNERGKEYDCVPEFIEYLIIDDIDFDSEDIQKILRKSINKHLYKDGKYYHRKTLYV